MSEPFTEIQSPMVRTRKKVGCQSAEDVFGVDLYIPHGRLSRAELDMMDLSHEVSIDKVSKVAAFPRSIDIFGFSR